MRLLKKALSLLLITAMVIGMVPISAKAANEYNVEMDSCTVIGTYDEANIFYKDISNSYQGEKKLSFSDFEEVMMLTDFDLEQNMESPIVSISDLFLLDESSFDFEDEDLEITDDDYNDFDTQDVYCFVIMDDEMDIFYFFIKISNFTPEEGNVVIEQNVPSPGGNDIVIDFSFSLGDSIYIIPNLPVHAGEAAEYNVGSSTSSPTVLDAVAAAHKIKYKGEFTKANAGNYVNSSLSKAFEESGYAGHALNGQYSDLYGTQAVIKSGDSVDLFFYESSSYSDSYVFFAQNSEPYKTIYVTPGSNNTLELKSFMVMYQSSGADGIKNASNCNDVDIALYREDSTATDITGKSTSGQFTFTAPTSTGTYYLVGKKVARPSNNLIPLCSKVIVTNNIPDVINKPEISSASFTDSSMAWYKLGLTFMPSVKEYNIPFPVGKNSAELVFNVPVGNTVDGMTITNGYYSTTIQSGVTKVITVRNSKNETATYTFTSPKPLPSGDSPTEVTDYLAINSQYTNKPPYGQNPDGMLTGNMRSIGNFGGYVVFYYEEPIVDCPNNKYGVDFYIYGNANNGGSFPEPGQVYVSENGTTWYALAGSEHYEDDTLWNYSVTYSKTSDGKTTWSDNQGNSGTKNRAWPDKDIYALNNQVKSGSTSITLSGVCLPSSDGNYYSESASTTPKEIKFGYVDCYVNGTTNATDKNPYTETTYNASNNNGFDLAWAVDSNGNPINVQGKSFHYIKVQTASHIEHPAFGEKSTEITKVVRTIPKTTIVGKTTGLSSVNLTDGSSNIKVNLSDSKQIYDVNVGDMKYITLKAEGASGKNVFINNVKGTELEGIKVTKEGGKKLVRIIAQSGDKEPVIYLLRLTGTATNTNNIIEKVKLNVGGTDRVLATSDGKTYQTSVGYRIDSVVLSPIVAPGTTIKINGADKKANYPIVSGKNEFTIEALKGSESQTITVIINKDNPPIATGEVTVTFSLLGDDVHGEDGKIHTNKGGGLKSWISRQSYTLTSPAVVLDVLEKALKASGYSFTNAGGNYISQINGLEEFDNGPKSGWMFTINGKHPSLGVAEQGVNNGDVIVFHYTDDYTKEEGSESWGGQEFKAPEAATLPADGVANISADVKVEGGKATVGNITAKDIENIIQNFEKENTQPTKLEVNVSGKSSNTIKNVAIPTESLKAISDAINDKTNSIESFDVVMSDATLSFDGASIKVLAGSGNGQVNLKVTGADKTNLNPAQIEAIKNLDVAEVYEFTASIGDKFITSFGNGNVSVGITYMPQQGKDAKHYHYYKVEKDGKLTIQKTKFEGGKFVRIGNTFSDYILVYDPTKTNAGVVYDMIYRLYNPANGEHLYTTDVNEVGVLTGGGWKNEPAIGLSVSKGKGVYRLYNTASGEHLYTADTNEIKVLTADGVWVYDNNRAPMYYGGESGSKPVYRVYNENLAAVARHHYTSDINETKVLTTKNNYVYDNDAKPVYYLK